MDEIIPEFLIESYEGLDQLDQNLVVLEGQPNDVAILKEVFRTLHTIKGTCGFLDFGYLEKVAHAGENLLSLLRDGKLMMSPQIADALLATVDKIRSILDTIDETGNEGQPDIEDLVARLAVLSADAEQATETNSEPDPDALTGSAGSAEPDRAGLGDLDFFDLQPPVPEPASPEVGESETPASEPLMPEFAAPAPGGPEIVRLEITGAENVAPHMPETPVATPVGEPEASTDLAQEPHGDLPPAAAPASVSGSGSSPEPPQMPESPPSPAPETAPSPAQATQQAAANQEPDADSVAATPENPSPPPPRLGDVLVDAGAANRTDVEIAAAEQSLGDTRQIGKILVDDGRADAKDVELAAGKRASASESTIRVDVALLDQLMNLVGELVLSRNQIIRLAAEDDDHEFGPPAQRLNLITSELQEGVMKTRMQPINNVWNKLPRIVRDLSSQLDKKVRIEMVGKHTELDRTIIEAIKDPLTHIVRNTVDHGIESPEIRVERGKEPEGLLLLRASHEGGQVNIEITDDGGGIDPEAVRAKAIDKGLVDAEGAAMMTDKEILLMIFRPGFSTAAAVTNVSGRGVGMDVVKTNVEKIGGTVDLQSKPGVGTTFQIKIPLTLAIIPALTVACNDNRYAIPQVNLLELVRLDRQDGQLIEDLHGTPVYRLRGRLLPIVDFRRQLGLEPLERDVMNIVVLNADGHHFGLVVDAIEDTEEIVVKPLGRQVKNIKLFSGATIRGDGRVALILDVLGLADDAGLMRPGSASAETTSAPGDEHGWQLLDDRTLLLLGVGPDERVAIALASVQRLEKFPASMIERSEGQLVIQYRHTIMPLIDLGPTLGFGQSALVDRERVSVVVCTFDGRTVGLAVQEILDIVSNAEAPETSSDHSQSVVVHGQITDVIDPAAVASTVLPVVGPAQHDWAPEPETRSTPVGVTQ